MRRYLYLTYRRLYTIDRWIRRRFTPSGFLLLGAMVAAAVFGVDTRQNLAYQLAALLAVLLLLALLASLRYRPRLAIERQLPRFATVGERTPYRIRIANRGGRHERDLRVMDEATQIWPTLEEFRAAGRAARARGDRLAAYFGYGRWVGLIARRRGADIAPVAAPPIPPHGQVMLDLAIAPVRRGYVRFEQVRVARPDPLGLCYAYARLPLPGSILVVPKTYPLPQMRFEGGRKYQRGGVMLAQSIGNEAEFVALRDYRPGDPLKLIHWRSFAKLGKPVVREMQDEYFTRYALILDTFTDPEDELRFEAAVSVAASVALVERGLESLLDLMFVGGAAYQFTTGRGVGQDDELLEVLACVEPADHNDFDALATLVFDHLGTLSGCICVLLDWDDPRQALVSRLRTFGVHTSVLLVGEETAPAPDAVTRIRPDQVAEDLAQWAP